MGTRQLGPVVFVSLSISLCAAAVLAAVALSNLPIVAAQAPASGGSAYTAIADSGDVYIIPPDTDVGIPLPPGDGFLLDDLVTVSIFQPFADPPWFPNGWAPLLCPRKKAPANNQAATVRAIGDPDDWGLYFWSCVIDPNPEQPIIWHATGPDAAFESERTGTYGAWVDYYYIPYDEWATDYSGDIRVFDAELTLNGTPDASEESPGAFMALDSPGKLLTLTMTPADPDTAMPDEAPQNDPNRKFHEGQAHERRAPYTVTLTAGTAVSIWSDPPGENPLTDLVWGWKKVGQTETYVEQEPPYPAHLWVVPEDVGAGDLEVTLQYNTINECPDWAPDRGGDGTNIARDRVKVSVIAVQLWVNGTDTFSDDYVVKQKEPQAEPLPANVPAGATDNHIPLTVKLLGPQGTTCHLKLSHTSTGSGHVRFTKEDGAEIPPEGIPITVGAPPLNVRIYGTDPSSALNDVEIQARTVETGNDVCGYEYVTVVWFNEADLHFRGSDCQGQGLTEHSTATFKRFASWLRNEVGMEIYPKPLDWDWDRAQGQMEIRCQPNPDVKLTPDLTWDIKRDWSCAYWGPGVGGTLAKHVRAGEYTWAYDDYLPGTDEDSDQNDGLTSIMVIDGPGFGDANAGLPYTAQCRFNWKSKFHEWIEVKIGGKWYVCSPYKDWRCIMHLEFKGQQQGWGYANGINEIVPGTIGGFAHDWNDD